MSDPTLEEAFIKTREHLRRGEPEHFHAVAYDPSEWHRESLFTTPPLATQALAEAALKRPPFNERFELYELAVVRCDFACPESGVGDLTSRIGRLPP